MVPIGGTLSVDRAQTLDMPDSLRYHLQAYHREVPYTDGCVIWFLIPSALYRSRHSWHMIRYCSSVGFQKFHNEIFVKSYFLKTLNLNIAVSSFSQDCQGFHSSATAQHHLVPLYVSKSSVSVGLGHGASVGHFDISLAVHLKFQR